MIKYRSDNLIRLNGPTNAQTDATIGSGTCTANLYDERKDTLLDADEAIGQTILSVANPTLFNVDDDVIVIELDDKSLHDGGLVTDSSVSAGTITITNSISGSAAKAGSRVMVKLGATVTLAAYGTPVANTFDWGFEGVMESDHADIVPGLKVRVEINLDASGIVLLETVRTDVVVGS